MKPGTSIVSAGKPKLTIVVIAHNMARELPRTIRSLSTEMQRHVDDDEYEVIVIDNGSSKPFSELECRRWIPEVRIHYLENATVSPVPAINRGLELANGELVGVCIDGARMVSPGMLAMALRASRLHDRPVIGTLAFHLGPDVQMRSIKNGYNQAAEDELLASSGWEDDGYQLFNIAQLAGASRCGWFVLPNESNALFLKREHWIELGGYDSAFVTPGGGIVNHDMWARACSDPCSQVIMLLGEATFHQVHGGIATNAIVSKRELFREEYLAIRGRAYRKPKVDPLYVGTINQHSIASMQLSMDSLLQRSK